MKTVFYKINSIVLSVLFLTSCISFPCFAQGKTYRIEVLQITELEQLQNLYEGFISELEKQGLVKGKNLSVKRTVIPFDIENQTMSKEIRAYLRIRKESSRIAREMPDLVLTMGSPATKYSKDRIIAAGIPLVFTALAFPMEVGTESFTVAGPGLTGAITYMDMREALKVVRQAFPELKTLGIVHSDDANGYAHVDEAIRYGSAFDFTFITKEVKMKDPITPELKGLRTQGAQAFAVPPDPYYAIRGYTRANELIDFSQNAKAPVISFVIGKFPGSVLEVGVDFKIIGSLAGMQAAKILKNGAAPGSLPILRQQNLTVLVHTKTMKALGIRLPESVLKVAEQMP